MTNTRTSWNGTSTATTSNATRKSRILVPGAGLGRLAYEIYNIGIYDAVEANEISIVMSAAAHQLLHYKVKKGNETDAHDENNSCLE